MGDAVAVPVAKFLSDHLLTQLVEVPMLYKDELDDFRYAQQVKGKGALSLVVQLTRAFSKDSLPIDPADYVTGKQGQVAGLGEANLRKILADHGITRQLAKEAGRTNRGNMGLMHAYAEFINSLPEPVDFNEIETTRSCASTSTLPGSRSSSPRILRAA